MRSPVRLYQKLRENSLGDILSEGPGYLRNELALKGREIYYRRALHSDPGTANRRRRAAVDRALTGDTVLFLCHGNICRSPFAARYARQQLQPEGEGDVTVESAGLSDLSGAASPADAQRIAARHGIDLGDYRSEFVDDDLITSANLVLLMDYRNYHDLATRYPSATDRTFLLGIFGGDPQIDDPYGRGPRPS